MPCSRAASRLKDLTLLLIRLGVKSARDITE